MWSVDKKVKTEVKLVNFPLSAPKNKAKPQDVNILLMLIFIKTIQAFFL